ncbi:hypothetical protein FOZ63_003515 [Perkinsus olseni]|uniref:Uncharacterized protein n=1 Tax=Perkinsus olseni TaxID=32597 RepID=A0A7J6RIG1_PEROL|nr:hypothetical protein FOZ63_003515 [Perkinsus olseni]
MSSPSDASQATNNRLSKGCKRFPDWDRHEGNKLKCPRCHKLIAVNKGSYSGVAKHEDSCKKQHAEAKKTDNKLLQDFVKAGVSAETEALLIEFVINSGSPLNLVDDKHFRKFVTALNRNYKPPSRRALSNRILSRMDNHFQAVKAWLREARSVNLTMDVWSRSSRSSFLSLMGHTIIENQLKAVVLDFRKLSGRHTAEAISAVVKDVVLQCGIVGRVRAITSDAAAVNVKAVKLLACDDEFTDGREICHLLCGAHKLHLSVVNSLSVWGRSSSDALSSDSDGSDGDVEGGRAPESQPESGDSDLSDWLNEATDTESEDVDEKCDMAWSSGVERQVRRNNRPILATLTKLRAHGRLVRQSNIAWSELEGCIKKEKESIGDSTKVKIIPRDIITRWNSTMFLIRWFLDDANKKGFINFQSICLKRRPSDSLRKHMVRYKLDVDDFANAENVHCVVTDIELATRLLSGSRYCSLSAEAGGTKLGYSIVI